MTAPLYCSAPTEALYAYGSPVAVPIDADPQKPLPREIVWIPAGDHEIFAHGAGMQPVQARVVCDETSACSIIAHFEELRAKGSRVWLDKNHEDAEATADVRAFAWDPARGIVATVDWTPYGERLLRDRVFCSFSPAFLRNKATGRPATLIVAKSAGGLVNAPAFGAAMPALIAARMAGAEITATTEPAGSAGDSSTMTKEQLIKLLAALGVTLAPDADQATTDAAIAQALAKTPTAASGSGTQPNAELEALRGQLATIRKDKAEAAVAAAIARGALPAKDETIHAKWVGLIQADPSHEQLLAAMPGNPALERKTQPGSAVVGVRDGAVEVLRAMAATPVADTAKRADIYASSVAPLFKDGFALGPILAANSLGTLAPELSVQRSLSLLKHRYPFLFSITTDFSEENAAYGQTIKTRLRGALTANEFVAGTGYGGNDASTPDVSITINKNYGVPVKFNVNELAATNRDLFGEQAEAQHNALATTVVDALLALITAGNFSKVSASKLSLFTRTVVTGLAKEQNKDKVTTLGRFLLLNPDFFEKLGQDSTIMQLAAFRNPEFITEYRLPPVGGYQPFEAATLPSTGSLAGFAGTPETLALATRVPNDYSKAVPGASNGIVSVVKNIDTGISVQLVQYVDHSLAEAGARTSLMFGVAVGNAATGRRLTQTAEA